MRHLLLLFLVFFSIKSVAQNPVLVISIDGFAYHYLAKYQPKNILGLMANGATINGLIPSFPSKTFPNHITLATGVYPAEHGIVHNNFYHRGLKQHYKKGAAKDHSEWLTAMPIWSLAEQQGIKTAVYFWPEAEAKIAQPRPSYLVPYKHNTPSENGMAQIFRWLALPKAQRPELIMSYFSVIDNVGHKYGVESKELAQAIIKFDQQLGQLLNKVKQELAVTPTIILVSDHGMVNINQSGEIYWPNLVKPFKQLHVVNGQTQLYVYEKDQQRLNDVRSHLLSLPQAKSFNVYQKADYPKHWHFDQTSSAMPDLVVDAIAPAIFVEKFSIYGGATHGFDAKTTPSMKAIFIANGSNITSGVSLAECENIHVMPFIAHLLNIKLPLSFNNRPKSLTPLVSP